MDWLNALAPIPVRHPRYTDYPQFSMNAAVGPFHPPYGTSPEGLHPKDIQSRRDINMTVSAFSSRRGSLASLENAFAVAIQLRETTGIDQFVVRTDNPIQPFRVSRCRPHHPEHLLALVA